MKVHTLIVLLATCTTLTAFCGGVQISNVKASQRSKDTGSVDITFDLSSDSNKVSVILSAMNTDNNQKVRMNAIYDEAGNFLGNPAKIESGNGRHLVWNSALDLGKGFYSSSMVVTVRATEYDLPLSRIQQYISDKETESQLLQEARTNAPLALAEAALALTKAKENLEDAEDALEELSVENLANTYYAAVEAASVSRTNAAAFAATTNLFGVSTLAGFKANNGLQLASKVVRDPITHEVVETVFDWDTTLKYNNNIYNTGVGGTTNAVIAKKAIADEAWDAVNTNRYVITIDGEEAIKYGSKAAAAYIADQYSKTPIGATIAVSAYTDSVGTTVDPMRTLGATAFTDKAIVDKYNAYATADAAALVKANTALETAQDANATATAAFKVFCETAYAAREAESTALNRYSNRKILQAAAQKEVDAAQTACDAAQKAYDDAKKTCEELGL